MSHKCYIFPGGEKESEDGNSVVSLEGTMDSGSALCTEKELTGPSQTVPDPSQPSPCLSETGPSPSQPQVMEDWMSKIKEWVDLAVKSAVEDRSSYEASGSRVRTNSAVGQKAGRAEELSAMEPEEEYEGYQGEEEEQYYWTEQGLEEPVWMMEDQYYAEVGKTTG